LRIEDVSFLRHILHRAGGHAFARRLIACPLSPRFNGVCPPSPAAAFSMLQKNAGTLCFDCVRVGRIAIRTGIPPHEQSWG